MVNTPISKKFLKELFFGEHYKTEEGKSQDLYSYRMIPYHKLESQHNKMEYEKIPPPGL